MIDFDNKEFQNSFSSFFENSNKLNKKISTRENRRFESYSPALEGHATDNDSVLAVENKEYALQKIVRKWLDKDDSKNVGKIGVHPDFSLLLGTNDVCYQSMTSMFIDIKNSTRLTLVRPLEDVQIIKNSVLRAASELVRSFDGHVHRFMGDALMAFFGGKNQSKESSALAAISCAALLRVFMKESVLPFLKNHFDDKDLDIGFRVGIDFGDDNDILWSSYGYSQVNEVTATSFYVDVASKLQSLASKDNVMLGQNIIDFLDFPECLQRIKTKINNGQVIDFPFLKPNYSLNDGSLLNYRIRELDFLEYLSLLPIPTKIKERYCENVVSHDGVKASVEISFGGEVKKYVSISRAVEKGSSVKFEVRIDRNFFTNGKPKYCVFKKQNYGKEAHEAVEDGGDKLEVKEIALVFSKNKMSNRYEPEKINFERCASYRGLHFVTTQVLDEHRDVLFSEVIGVYVS